MKWVEYSQLPSLKTVDDLEEMLHMMNGAGTDAAPIPALRRAVVSINRGGTYAVSYKGRQYRLSGS